MPKGYLQPIYSRNSGGKKNKKTKKTHGAKGIVSKGKRRKGSGQRGNAGHIMLHLGPTVTTPAFTLSKLESQGGFCSKKVHDLTYILKWSLWLLCCKQIINRNAEMNQGTIIAVQVREGATWDWETAEVKSDQILDILQRQILQYFMTAGFCSVTGVSRRSPGALRFNISKDGTVI